MEMNAWITYRIFLNQESKNGYYKNLMMLKAEKEEPENLQIRSNLLWLLNREMFNTVLENIKFVRETPTDLATGMPTVSYTVTLREKDTYKNTALDVSITFLATETLLTRCSTYASLQHPGILLSNFIDLPDLIDADIFINYIEEYSLKLDLFQTDITGYAVICEIPEQTIISTP